MELKEIIELCFCLLGLMRAGLLSIILVFEVVGQVLKLVLIILKLHRSHLINLIVVAVAHNPLAFWASLLIKIVDFVAFDLLLLLLFILDFFLIRPFLRCLRSDRNVTRIAYWLAIKAPAFDFRPVAVAT